MGQDPDTIRQQIAETRAEMEDTVDALGYKADVKARAKENVQGKVGTVTGKVTAVKEKIVGQATHVADATPSTSDVKDQFGQSIGGAKDSLSSGADTAKQNARQAASVAQENPLGLAVGAIALGFLGGLLVPSTRIEEEKIGPVADQLKEQAAEVGHEAVERAQAVASEVASVAKDAASEAADVAKNAAGDAQSAAKEAAATPA